MWPEGLSTKIGTDVETPSRSCTLSWRYGVITELSKPKAPYQRPAGTFARPPLSAARNASSDVVFGYVASSMFAMTIW